MRRGRIRAGIHAGISEPVPDELSHAWTRVETELRRAVPTGRPQRILATLEPRRLDGSTFVVAAPDAHRAYIADRFGRVLQACVSAVLGAEITVEVTARSEQSPDARRPTPKPPGPD